MVLRCRASARRESVPVAGSTHDQAGGKDEQEHARHGNDQSDEEDYIAPLPRSDDDGRRLAFTVAVWRGERRGEGSLSMFERAERADQVGEVGGWRSAGVNWYHGGGHGVVVWAGWVVVVARASPVKYPPHRLPLAPR